MVSHEYIIAFTDNIIAQTGDTLKIIAQKIDVNYETLRSVRAGRLHAQRRVIVKGLKKHYAEYDPGDNVIYMKPSTDNMEEVRKRLDAMQSQIDLLTDLLRDKIKQSE